MAEPAAVAAVDVDDDEVELAAIADIIKRLKPLSTPAKRRVVAFVADKVGVALGGGGAGAAGRSAVGSSVGSGGATPSELPKYQHFAQLANRVRPDNELFKVLIACYWAQMVEGTSPFATKQVNPRLTEISVGLGHVTERLQDLQDLNPSYVIHIKTPGQTKKSYLMTDEGIAAVEDAIRTGGFPKPAKKA
ncbi:MAG: hypothetical protein ACRDP6_44135 [Actinoallomurus sp.]